MADGKGFVNDNLVPPVRHEGQIHEDVARTALGYESTSEGAEYAREQRGWRTAEDALGHCTKWS